MRAWIEGVGDDLKILARTVGVLTGIMNFSRHPAFIEAQAGIGGDISLHSPRPDEHD